MLIFWQTVEFIEIVPVLETFFLMRKRMNLCSILLQNSNFEKETRQDFRIAAIALSHNITVATCNHSDFWSGGGIEKLLVGRSIL
jgi:hypothetical protein